MDVARPAASNLCTRSARSTVFPVDVHCSGFARMFATSGHVVGDSTRGELACQTTHQRSRESQSQSGHRKS